MNRVGNDGYTADEIEYTTRKKRAAQGWVKFGPPSVTLANIKTAFGKYFVFAGILVVPTHVGDVSFKKNICTQLFY